MLNPFILMPGQSIGIHAGSLVNSVDPMELKHVRLGEVTATNLIVRVLSVVVAGSVSPSRLDRTGVATTSCRLGD